MIAFNDHRCTVNRREQGILKDNPEDFVGGRRSGFCAGWRRRASVQFWILKRTAIRGFVADALAKLLKIHAREVSFAGQKDKHAVTASSGCVPASGKGCPI
ncbi:hypothetical protein DMH17_13370 [Raoultella planticola]|nr:hypothetical protein [Raoultella planticola]